jgi:hypothetical protein
MHKAGYGKKFTWTGFALTIRPKAFRAEIPADKMADLLAIVQEYLTVNVIAVKKVRSLAGKASNISGILIFWRPFLNELWAATHSTAQEMSAAPVHFVPAGAEPLAKRPRTGATPKGCIWTFQIMLCLVWLEAFMLGNAGAIVREWSLASYIGACTCVDLVLDASPYGLGGFITINSKPVEFFAQELSSFDFKFFGAGRGESEGQQTWEALAILVAVRMWKRYFKHYRAQLHITGDNMSALQLLATLKTRGVGPSRIARELALDLAEGDWGPDDVAHLPGVSNRTSDVLSRKFDPHKSFALPAYLEGVEEAFPPVRGTEYFRSCRLPRTITRPLVGTV